MSRAAGTGTASVREIAGYEPDGKVDYAVVRVRIDRAVKNEDGTYSLWIPSPKLNAEQHEQLRAFFPHLAEQAYELLSKELLLSILA